MTEAEAAVLAAARDPRVTRDAFGSCEGIPQGVGNLVDAAEWLREEDAGVVGMPSEPPGVPRLRRGVAGDL